MRPLPGVRPPAVLLANVALAWHLMFFLVPAAAAMSIIGMLFLSAGSPIIDGKRHTIVFANPADLAEVVRFGFLLAVVFIAVTMLRHHGSQSGLVSLTSFVLLLKPV